MTLKKSIVAVSMLFGSAGAAFATCGDPAFTGLFTPTLAAFTTLILGKLTAMSSAIISMDNTQTEALVASLRVATKQVQASGDKSGIVSIRSEEAVSSVRKEIFDAELANKVVTDYRSQGFDPCGISSVTQRAAYLEFKSRKDVPTMIRTEIEAGGGRYASPEAAVVAREKRHRELFCTESDVAAGLCGSIGKVPGGDMNSALIFNTDASADMRAAKNAVINNIIGLPDAPVPSDVANTPEASAYVLEKKKKDAFLSFPAYSLKMIQSEGETFKAVMDDRVGRYFGTPQATEWAKDQMSEAPRGLMVDIVKIEGMNLKLAERRIQQRLRMEANLAALLELENQAMNGAQGRRAEATISNNAARGKVN